MVQRRLNTERIQVAATLRRMREDAGLTRDDVAAILGCTSSKIGDLETGRSGPKPVELEKLLDHFGVAGEERDEMIEFARESQGRKPRGTYTAAFVPANHRRALDLEAQAVSSIFYSGEVIPGILQVRAYAEAMTSWGRESKPEEVQKLVKLRMGRKEALDRTHRPPLKYWCILGEAALRSGVGGPTVMAEQLAHLVQLNESMPNVVVQVMPLGSGVHPLQGFTITLHSFPEPAPDIMAVDGHGRDAFHDGPGEVARVSGHFELVKAKALGLEESTACLRRILRELEKASHAFKD